MPRSNISAPRRAPARGAVLLVPVLVAGAHLLAQTQRSSSAAASGSRPQPPPGHALGVPAYFYPAGAGLADWDRLRAGAPAVRTVIATGLGLDGKVPDRAYRSQIDRTRAAGIEVLAYVGTSSGDKPPEAAKREIDRAYQWYDVDGIFFDEAVRFPVTCEQVGYYGDLGRHAKAHKASGTTVINHGQILPECYAEVTDVMMNAETSARSYRSWYPWGWEERYPPEKFWHLVHGAGTVGEMQEVLALSRARGAGRVFVTPAGPESPGGPYGSLPPADYWKAEGAAVS